MPVRKKAPEDLTAKKALALEVIRRLKAEYPDAGCTLDYDHAWQLLVSVRLAAQCTDARVNIVVEELFAKYPSVAALAAAEPEDIEAIVKPCGLGHSKARDISACMRMLRDKYDCRVPDTFDELLALPGVGRKSANLIMGDVFGKPAIVTDTHCIRLCNKIGLVGGIKEPQKVEMALWKIIPPEEGSDLCHRFVMHGRAVCNARKPECEKCCLKDICRTAREAAGQQADHRHAAAGAEQQPKGVSGRLHAEHPGYAAARVGGKGLHPPSGCQHRRRCRGTAKPRCRRGKGRVCGAEGCAQHRTSAQGGKPLCPAAQRQLCGGTRQHPGRKPPPPHTAQRRRHGCAHQQRAHARALRGKSTQPKADARRKQCVRRAVQQKVCPAAAAQRKAQRHAGQCAAARQRGGYKLLRQQPAGCHGSAQRTQLTQAAQRERTQPVEQQPQRRPCRAGGKAILCQPKGQPQPKGHQRPVQHRPAAGKADAHRCQPPRRRAQHRPCR